MGFQQLAALYEDLINLISEALTRGNLQTLRHKL